MLITVFDVVKPPRHFSKLRGGLDEGDFYFINIYILKIENKNLSQSNY